MNEYDKLVFEENFDEQKLNLSKWGYDLGNGNWGWGNAELEYYRNNKENIYIENNQLHIRAKVESYGGKDYTSARITTKHTFHFTYGYIETKIKLPIGKGIWPAFWMLGGNLDEIDWPSCGEIDILETKNDEKRIYNTVHWKNEENNEYNKYSLNREIENFEEFHKYGAEWTDKEIIMYVDDLEYFRIDLNGVKSTAFQKPFYLLLNLAVGGNFPASDIDKTVFPLEMIIDYIKIYQKEENYKYLKKHLIFYDDFNGKDLDTTKWSYDIGVGENGWGTNQKQYYTNRKDNIFLSESNLHIRAKRENYKNNYYTSGRINTKYSMNFTYGIIETKIKFPSADGVSSGMWLLGLDNNNCPKCGKIDALIKKDNNNQIYSGCAWDINKSYYLNSQIDITKFNEYLIIWDKNYITVYIDDLEIYKIDINLEDLNAFHKHFYINFNVLVGGYTVDKNIDNSAFPIDMIIDYIKVYQYDLNNSINIIIDDNSPNKKTTLIEDIPTRTIIKTNSITSLINDNIKTAIIHKNLRTTLISIVPDSETINNNFNESLINDILNLTILNTKIISSEINPTKTNMFSNISKSNIFNSILQTEKMINNSKSEIHSIIPNIIINSTISKSTSYNIVSKLIENSTSLNYNVINTIQKTSINCNILNSTQLNRNSKTSIFNNISKTYLSFNDSKSSIFYKINYSKSTIFDNIIDSKTSIFDNINYSKSTLFDNFNDSKSTIFVKTSKSSLITTIQKTLIFNGLISTSSSAPSGISNKNISKTSSINNIPKISIINDLYKTTNINHITKSTIINDTSKALSSNEDNNSCLSLIYSYEILILLLFLLL